ncbi:hypothetical protein GRJ2_001651000 [Grus japonensis]|uniref:Uncharacterized protein n=1 Tax=Grus japonensis TaxID=30415 RepID=A0ABC9X4L8_GRUJA
MHLWDETQTSGRGGQRWSGGKSILRGKLSGGGDPRGSGPGWCPHLPRGQEPPGRLHRHLPNAARCAAESRCVGDRPRGCSPAASAADPQPSAPRPP